MYLYIVMFPNNKKYIGITNSIKRRKNDYIKECKNKSNRQVIHAIKKYGWNNIKWEVADGYISWKDLCIIEIKEIERHNTYCYDKDSNGYNMTRGGEGAYGAVRSDETKEKISKSLRGKMVGGKNPFFGKVHSQETREKLSRARKGKQSGKDNPMFGKKHSKETREKISKSLIGLRKGIPKSKEWKKQMSRIKSGEKGPMAKLTRDQVKKIRFIYINEKISYKKLGKRYNVSAATICNIITNKTWKG